MWIESLRAAAQRSTACAPSSSRRRLVATTYNVVLLKNKGKMAMLIYIMTRWAVRFGSFASGAYMVWSDQILYRIAALAIFVFFVLLWARATIRRAADAKFAAVLEMARRR